MKQRSKRKLLVVNTISKDNYLDMAEAHTVALLILNQIKAPAEAEVYLDKAISLFAHTLADLRKRYEAENGKPLLTQHVIDAFTGPSDETETVAG